MTWSLRQMTAGGIALALALLIVTGLAAFHFTDDLVDTTQQAIRSQAVLAAVDQVVSDLADAEAGQRSYIITGDSHDLEQYEIATRQYPQDLQTLRTLTADSPTQQERIDHLVAVAARRLAELSETIEARRLGYQAESVRAVVSGRGRATMDDVRQTAATIRQEEESIFATQSATVQDRAQLSTISIIGGSAMAFLLVALSSVVAYREMLASRRANEALDRARAELEQRVAERTAELRQANESLQLEIGERELAQEELLTANLQLERALDDVGQAHAVMVRQERFRALGELASGIAHDFNNSLSMIIGFTELLLADPANQLGSDDAREKVRLIHSAASDAAAVVGRLRDFYRSGLEGTDFVPVQLNDVIAQAVSLTQPRWRDQSQAAGRTIDLETDLAQVPPIAGRDSDLRDALANLILNAVDAMPTGGKLTIRSRSVGEHVIVEVSDTGIGMPAEIRQRVFEPFFTTKGESGTGLGLALVHNIVERHSGEIHVASAAGHGTTFTIRLPAVRAEISAPAADVDVNQAASLRVLLVEDEPALRQILVSYLRIDHHQVTATADGREALQAFWAGEYDLVLTDRAMPNFGGDQLAVEIKRLSPTTPVIMLTGLGDLMRELDERPPGVDLVIGKPIGLAGLRTAVASVLPDEAPPSPS